MWSRFRRTGWAFTTQGDGAFLSDAISVQHLWSGIWVWKQAEEAHESSLWFFLHVILFPQKKYTGFKRIALLKVQKLNLYSQSIDAQNIKIEPNISNFSHRKISLQWLFISLVEYQMILLFFSWRENLLWCLQPSLHRQQPLEASCKTGSWEWPRTMSAVREGDQISRCESSHEGCA